MNYEKEIIKLALKEDIGKGDITTENLIPLGKKGIAVIIAKEKGILAGGRLVKEIFSSRSKNIKVVQLVKDGEEFSKGNVLFKIEGNLRTILTCERVVLNFLQYLSGVATLTNRFVKKIANTRIKILDTRKTLPGVRLLSKYAVRCGGGMNHRLGLWDMILIKDNHIKAVGGVKEVLKKVKKGKTKIEIEVKTLTQLKEVLNYQIDWIMLDNMSVKDMKEAIRLIRKSNPNIKIEISGGVNLKTISSFATLDVDYISVGALTHSPKAIDLTLKIKEVR
jgi:nicotinate-nucleotide pyrophosphorylase (carboxylating)